MRHLYSNGQGAVYRETISWLSSSDDTLQTAAALAIGNFARKGQKICDYSHPGVEKLILD